MNPDRNRIGGKSNHALYYVKWEQGCAIVSIFDGVEYPKTKKNFQVYADQ